jgi:hypothetical protein
MKKLILLTVVMVSVFALNALSQTKPAIPLKGPVIQFGEMSHDFGTINEGTRASDDFEFTNTGDSALLLINVQASCGCTVPTWPKQPIKPGQKDKISVVYNSEGRPGEFHKSITVTTNMKQDNVKIIYIKGTVTPKPAPAPAVIPPLKTN